MVPSSGQRVDVVRVIDDPLVQGVVADRLEQARRGVDQLGVPGGAVVTLLRHLDGGQVLRLDVAEREREVLQRQAVVDGERLATGTDQPVQLAEVPLHALLAGGLEQRLEELLLVPHPCPVTLRELLALPDVVERPLAVEVLAPLVERTVRLVDRHEAVGAGRGLDAHVHAAEHVDHSPEAVEVDHRTAVELHLHQPGQRLRQQPVSPGPVAAVSESGVDLVLAALPLTVLGSRNVHPGVPRERDQVGVVVARLYVQHDDRVVSPHRVRGLPAVVRADQEDVQRTFQCGPAGRLLPGSAEQIVLGDVAGVPVDQDVHTCQRGAGEQDEYDAEDQAQPRPPGAPPPAPYCRGGRFRLGSSILRVGCVFRIGCACRFDTVRFDTVLGLDTVTAGRHIASSDHHRTLSDGRFTSNSTSGWCPRRADHEQSVTGLTRNWLDHPPVRTTLRGPVRFHIALMYSGLCSTQLSIFSSRIAWNNVSALPSTNCWYDTPFSLYACTGTLIPVRFSGLMLCSAQARSSSRMLLSSSRDLPAAFTRLGTLVGSSNPLDSA